MVQGDPDILVVVFDSGHDLPGLAWLLSELSVEVARRLHGDQVMHLRGLTLSCPATATGTRCSYGPHVRVPAALR